MKQIDIRRKLSSALFILAVPSYIYCGLKHICMSGHAHHPPYPTSDYISDFIWISFFALSGVFSRKSNLFAPKKYSLFIFLLAILRLPMGSIGGLTFVLEIPILIALVIWSIYGFFKPSTYYKLENNNEKELYQLKIKKIKFRVAITVIAIVVLSFGGYYSFKLIRNYTTPVEKLSSKNIPFNKNIKMYGKNIYRFVLPNNKQFYLWTMIDEYSIGEQQTKSGLQAIISDAPFEYLDDDSFIKHNSVSTSDKDNTSKNFYEINNYNIILTEYLEDTPYIGINLKIENKKK